MTVTTGARGSCSASCSGGGFFFGEGFRVVQLGGQRLVAHLLDDDHRRLLVELLVDGDHLAQLHQLLDDLGGLDAHLVRQVGHRDGLGHVHFLDLLARPAARSSGRCRRRGRRGGRRAARASRRGCRRCRCGS
jgi:hypothetical protein